MNYKIHWIEDDLTPVHDVFCKYIKKWKYKSMFKLKAVKELEATVAGLENELYTKRYGLWGKSLTRVSRVMELEKEVRTLCTYIQCLGHSLGYTFIDRAEYPAHWVKLGKMCKKKSSKK